MGKKSRIAASAATAGRNSRLIENLKTVNINLAKEVAQSQKQLRFHFASMAADREICDGIERDVLALVLSSSLREAAERTTVEMTAATEREKNLIAELNAAEMRLFFLVTEKDAKNKEMEDLKERLQSMEEKEKASERGKPWKNWLYSVAVTVILLATTALVTFCCN